MREKEIEEGKVFLEVFSPLDKCLFPSFLEKPQPYPSVAPYPCPAAVPLHPVWSPGNSLSPAGGLLWRPPYAEIALCQGGCPQFPLSGLGAMVKG